MSDSPKRRTGYLLKDRQERFNMKRGWFVNAWRVVDQQGSDLFQPWYNTKREAIELAKQLNINIVGDYTCANHRSLGMST